LDQLIEEKGKTKKRSFISTKEGVILNEKIEALKRKKLVKKRKNLLNFKNNLQEKRENFWNLIPLSLIQLLILLLLHYSLLLYLPPSLLLLAPPPVNVPPSLNTPSSLLPAPPSVNVPTNSISTQPLSVIVSNNLVNSNLVSNTVSTPVVNNSYVLVRYPQVSYNLMVAQLDRIEGELMYVHRGIKQRNNSFKFESEAISLSNNSLIGGVVLTKRNKFH